jgi:hypothetical protein
MIRLFAHQIAIHTLACCAIIVFSVCAYAAELKGIHDISQPPNAPVVSGSAGGVLAESYHYHRQGEAHGRQAHSTIAPAGGWYGYGFPVQTYRWGWFGAERYYPRVVWHRGYYGDCCRWSYRDGY